MFCPVRVTSTRRSVNEAGILRRLAFPCLRLISAIPTSWIATPFPPNSTCWENTFKNWSYLNCVWKHLRLFISCNKFHHFGRIALKSDFNIREKTVPTRFLIEYSKRLMERTVGGPTLRDYSPRYFGTSSVARISEVHLNQAWATSGLRATYGPLSTLMWPASYIWIF